MRFGAQLVKHLAREIILLRILPLTRPNDRFEFIYGSYDEKLSPRTHVSADRDGNCTRCTVNVKKDISIKINFTVPRIDKLLAGIANKIRTFCRIRTKSDVSYWNVCTRCIASLFPRFFFFSAIARRRNARSAALKSLQVRSRAISKSRSDRAQ